MNIKKILTTPELAKHYLSKNINNRRINDQRVQGYVNDMLAGRWKEDTFEFIKIAKDGTVLDGQHRLSAVIKSNSAINLHFVFELEKSIFDVLDTGKPRGNNDALKIAGIPNSIVVSSVIQGYLSIKNCNLSSKNKDKSLSNTALLDYYNQNINYWNNKSKYTMSKRLAFSGVLTSKVIGSLSCLFDEINIDDSLDFMDQLTSGLNITNNSVHLLRKKLIANKINKFNAVSEKIVYAWIIRCWNAYRKNIELKIIKYAPNSDDFPIAL
jgi:hypothetical protein